MFSLQSITVTIAGLALTATAKHSNAITSLPPMGFSPFYWVQQEYNQSVMVNAATAMLENGLFDAGYNRLNLDGGWAKSSRDGDKALTWNTTTFPKGMPWLASFAKSKGFIPGIFTQAGTEACKFHAFPGSYGHEQVDLDAFVEWGFEYLIVDGCNFPDRTVKHSDEVWGNWYRSLAAANWPMYMVSEEQVYLTNRKSSEYNKALDFTWQHGPSARTSGDSAKYWQKDSWAINMKAYEHNMRAARYQTGGFLNDPDKLTPENPYLTFEQCKSLFALWCSMSAPLILSGNMSSLSNATLEYLTNKQLLNVNQDKLMAPATLISRDDTWDVLIKDLSNGDRVLTLLNRGKENASIKVPWPRLGFSSRNLTQVEVTDLWTNDQWKVPVSDGHVNISNVAPDGTAVLHIAPAGQSAIIPTGAIFNLFIPVYGAADLYPTTCLTDDTSGQVYWSACNASDAQVWAVAENGYVRSLLRPKACLADVNGSVRSRYGNCDKWSYYRSGNLENKSTRQCLSGGAPGPKVAGSGSAETQNCESFSVDQMFGLPGGVPLVDGQKPQP